MDGFVPVCSDDLEVDYRAARIGGPRFESTSCSSRCHRKRWSPYARKRKLFPKKAFSLESIPRTHANRMPSFELTQSTKDYLSDSTIDFESGVTENTVKAVEWLMSTGEDCEVTRDNSFFYENTSRGDFESKADSESTTDSGNYCNTVATFKTNQPSSSTKSESGEDSAVAGPPAAEWLFWCAYAKLMKLAWNKTRLHLNEQTHRAENCELQARSTMAQVRSMKAQLKSDISDMKESVQKIHSIRVILETTQEDRSKLKITNETMKSKVCCLKDEEKSLRDAISSCQATNQGYRAQAEALKKQIEICSEELKGLKLEKGVLEDKIQELLSLSDHAKEEVVIQTKNLYNRDVEMVSIQRELQASKEKTLIQARMVKTVKDQAVEVNREIEIAVEGGNKLQEQLAESRDKLTSRDSLIAEVRAKVEEAAEQISELKKAGKEKKSFWRRLRLRFLHRSLLSIQL